MDFRRNPRAPGRPMDAPTTPRNTDAGRHPAISGRSGGRLLLLGGGLLALSMVYILAWEGRDRRPRADDAAGVAVFFPDRRDWEDFRAGVRDVAARAGAEVVRDDPDAMTLRGKKAGRLVRFTWHGAGGLIDTREAVRRMADSASPPVAVVGSSNSVLTVALAEALRDAAEGSGRPGPVLLVPWATAVSVEAPGMGPGTVPLLSIYPGRTFRFCADNQRLASLAVQCLAASEPKGLPRRACLVVDRADSFSKDLADCFARAISAAAPHAEVDSYDLRTEDGSMVGPRRPDDGFGPSERRLAGRLWRAALEVPGREMVWIVLPLQEEPTLRMLKALRSEVWWDVGKGEEAPPLRVLCGDGLGRDTLQDLAATHDLPFPVWGVSSSSDPEGSESEGASRQGSVVGASSRQVPAEIASALLRCLDAPGDATPEGLRSAMAALDLKAGDPAALGRPLAFTPSGERRADDLGRVLEASPGQASLSIFTRGPAGDWTRAELPATVAIAPPPYP